MSAITLEKTYALLEKLTEYVMNELPTRKEMDAKLSHLEARLDARMDQMDTRMDQMEARMNQKFDKIIERMDVMAGELANQRIEWKAISKTLDVHNDRLGKLEQHCFGFRVMEKEE
jgi:hypothetical protein